MMLFLLCRNLHTAGGKVVGLNFIEALSRNRSKHSFTVVAPLGAGYEKIPLGRGNKLIVYRGGRNPIAQWRFDTFELPSIVKESRADVVFAMGNVGLVHPPCPQALLFHKSQLVYPARHYSKERIVSRLKNAALKRRLISCLRQTDLVFCQTPIARDRFRQEFGYREARIRIMPNAVSEFGSISKESAGVPPILRENSFYNLFFLTKFYAHKNLESLLTLFEKHSDRLKDVRCIVTVARDQHPNASKFLDEIRRQGLQEHIVNVGPLKQEELAGYFYNADALLFPTLLESFSGTYLEAMHFGLPILTSGLDFAEYVCGDAALYFDPWNADEICNRILLLRQNPKLKEELVAKGRERMKRFFKSWDEITYQTVTELEAIAN